MSAREIVSGPDPTRGAKSRRGRLFMLYVVATPIGNLKDISLRALEVLKSADLIACEDTRHARKLLSHYDIHVPLLSYYDHNEEIRLGSLLEKLREGKDVALISDAGMPVFQDPGYFLTRALIKENIPFTVIPGPTAAATALVLSGLPPDSFIFEGYLPPKSGQRQRKLRRLSSERRTVLFYESPHRLLSSLKDIREVLGDIEIVVIREMTKKFEEVVRKKVSEQIAHFEKKPPKGEFVILFSLKALDKKEEEI